MKYKRTGIVKSSEATEVSSRELREKNLCTTSNMVDLSPAHDIDDAASLPNQPSVDGPLVTP